MTSHFYEVEMETSRLYMLPEDCQRLIWNKVFDDCIKDIAKTSYRFWNTKKRNIAIHDNELSYQLDSFNEPDRIEYVITEYNHIHKLLYDVEEFLKELRYHKY